jgi:hypothetical protein
MKLIRFLLAALACAALAGCFTSDKPLVTDADSVADYSKVVFTSPEPDNQRSEFTRLKNHYVTRSHEDVVYLHLKRVEGDYYVAQLSGDQDGQVLYGYLHMDVAKGEAQTWRIYGSDADIQPGMHKCKDSICVDDLAVYIASGQKAVAAGEKPAEVFKLEAVK